MATLFKKAKKLETIQMSINWINKMEHIYTMEYCSSIKRNELLIVCDSATELAPCFDMDEPKKQ